MCHAGRSVAYSGVTVAVELSAEPGSENEEWWPVRASNLSGMRSDLGISIRPTPPTTESHTVVGSVVGFQRPQIIRRVARP